MATTYEIVQALSQAAANAYDGALTEDGEALKAGLQREEGDPLIDKRVMDGFNVKFYGPMMCLSYMSEVRLKEVYANGFESEIEQRIAEVAKFLKKEYKAVTGSTLSLTKMGDADMIVQNRSKVWTWVQAQCMFKIGGLQEVVEVTEEEKDLRDKFKDFLSLGNNN